MLESMNENSYFLLTVDEAYKWETDILIRIKTFDQQLRIHHPPTPTTAVKFKNVIFYKKFPNIFCPYIFIKCVCKLQFLNIQILTKFISG